MSLATSRTETCLRSRNLDRMIEVPIKHNIDSSIKEYIGLPFRLRVLQGQYTCVAKCSDRKERKTKLAKSRSNLQRNVTK